MYRKHKITPLVVIVGETASGKSALALDIAERYNGEIICADSRTVYKGMDIGTAKSSKAEQERIPHHLIDIINPNEPFNVASFQTQAKKVIEEISQRGKLPIMVGGTGLYVDSILFDYGFTQEPKEYDEVNPRHLRPGQVAKKSALPRPNTLILGLSVPKEILEERITKRVEAMIESGLEQEVRALADKYGWQAEAMTGVGYREWQEYFAGNQTLEQTKELIIIHTRQYAKRQRSWFKRNGYIHWSETASEALAFAENWPIEKRKKGKNKTGSIVP